MANATNAQGFATGLATFGESVGELCVDAIKRFTIEAGQKLCDYSPIAARPVRNRGLFLANWRASLMGRNDVPIEYPDAIGTQTVAGIARVVQSGPRELASWPEIHISNPHPGAEEIEQRHGIVARTARELADEARL